MSVIQHEMKCWDVSRYSTVIDCGFRQDCSVSSGKMLWENPTCKTETFLSHCNPHHFCFPIWLQVSLNKQISRKTQQAYKHSVTVPSTIVQFHASSALFSYSAASWNRDKVLINCCETKTGKYTEPVVTDLKGKSVSERKCNGLSQTNKLSFSKSLELTFAN